MRLLKKDYQFLEINKENINQEINILKSEIEELKKENQRLLNDNEINKLKNEEIMNIIKEYEDIKKEEKKIIEDKIINELKYEIESKIKKFNIFETKKIKTNKKEYNLEEIKNCVIKRCPVDVYNPSNEIEKEASKLTLKIILHYVEVYKKVLNETCNDSKLIEKKINEIVNLLIKENKYKNIKSNKYKYKNMLMRFSYLEDKYKNKLEYCNFNVSAIGLLNDKEWHLWLEYFESLFKK